MQYCYWTLNKNILLYFCTLKCASCDPGNVYTWGLSYMCEWSLTPLSKSGLRDHGLRLFQNAVKRFCFSSLQFANAVIKKS